MDSGFLTDLDVRLKEGSDGIWQVVSPLKYWSALLNCQIVVPPWFETAVPDTAGPEPAFFETDFASVPRVPFVYDAWGARAHREATLHDYLYRCDSIPVATYSQANRVFLEAMTSTGKRWCIRYPMYLGVVIGGWTAYHKHKVQDRL